MINDWRTRWGEGDIPFYYVQLPAYKTVSPSFRDQQTNLLTLPNTGMAVILELGETDNIHPLNKLDVGVRLSKIAIAKIYGQDITYSGPMYKSMNIEGNKIRVIFHPASIGDGLITRDGGPLSDFEVAGDNGIYFPANAIIDGNNVLVSSTNVSSPTKVRFAYSNTPYPNFINKDSLTACPFSSENWNDNISVEPIVNKINNVINKSFNIFPVPVDDYLKIKFEDYHTNIKLELFDVLGKSHLNSNVNLNSNSAIIDVSGFSKGLYILRMTVDRQVISKTFIKR